MGKKKKLGKSRNSSNLENHSNPIKFDNLFFWIVIITLTIGVFLIRFIAGCPIEPNVEYCWYDGIWQGKLFVVNWVVSLFDGALYKAVLCTTAYNVLAIV